MRMIDFFDRILSGKEGLKLMTQEFARALGEMANSTGLFAFDAGERFLIYITDSTKNHQLFDYFLDLIRMIFFYHKINDHFV